MNYPNYPIKAAPGCDCWQCRIVRDVGSKDAEIAKLRAALTQIRDITPSHYAREHAIIDAALEQGMTK